MFACNYFYFVRAHERATQAAALFSEQGFAGVVSHVEPQEPAGLIVGPESAVRDFIVRECGWSKRCSITPFGIFCRKQWDGNGSGQVAQQPQYPVPTVPPDAGVTVAAPGVGVQVGATGAQGPPGPAGKDAAPVDIKSIVAEILTQLKADPTLKGAPGAPGPAGKDGATGPQGPAGAIPNLSNLGITFVTPNTDGTSSVQFIPIGPPGGPGQPSTIGLKIPSSAVTTPATAATPTPTK